MGENESVELFVHLKLSCYQFKSDDYNYRQFNASLMETTKEITYGRSTKVEEKINSITAKRIIKPQENRGTRELQIRQKTINKLTIVSPYL